MWDIVRKVIAHAVQHAAELEELDNKAKVDFLGDYAEKLLDKAIELKPPLEQMSDLIIKAVVEYLVEPQLREWVDEVWPETPDA